MTIPYNTDIINGYRGLTNYSRFARSEIYTALSLDKLPTISRQDLDNGVVTRYFVRKTNLEDGEILEVSKPMSLKLQQNSLYRIVEVLWRIRGRQDDVPAPRRLDMPVRLYTGVVTSNRRAVEEASKEMPGLQHKLTDYLQFYQGD